MGEAKPHGASNETANVTSKTEWGVVLAVTVILGALASLLSRWQFEPWTSTDIPRLLLGLWFALALGHPVTSWVHGRLHGTKQQPTTDPWIRRWNGVAERFVYWASVVLQIPEGIAVYLAFKVAVRWSAQRKDTRSDDQKAIDAEGYERTAATEAANKSGIFAASAVVSLFFGVVGGMISLGRAYLS